MHSSFGSEKGFTLLETIIAAAMILFVANGILLAWQLADSKQQSLERYTQTKEELETAYEITVRTLRSQARGTVVLINDGKGVTFTGMDGLNWTFSKSGSDYYLTHGGVTRVLMEGCCDFAEFSLSGREVGIELSAAEPPDWTGDEIDLQIQGRVFIRNN